MTVGRIVPELQVFRGELEQHDANHFCFWISVNNAEPPTDLAQKLLRRFDSYRGLLDELWDWHLSSVCHGEPFACAAPRLVCRRRPTDVEPSNTSIA